jgi:hypothetical protein
MGNIVVYARLHARLVLYIEAPRPHAACSLHGHHCTSHVQSVQHDPGDEGTLLHDPGIQQECNSSTCRQRTRFTVGYEYSHDHDQKGVHTPTPTPNAKQLAPCVHALWRWYARVAPTFEHALASSCMHPCTCSLEVAPMHRSCTVCACTLKLVCTCGPHIDSSMQSRSRTNASIMHCAFWTLT